MIAVEFRCTIDHKARGPVQGRPGNQKCKCLEQALIVFSAIKGSSLSLDVVEVRKPLEVGAQMFLAKRTLKARPTRGLRIIATAKRIEYADSRILPVEIWPLASSMFGRLNRLQSFFISTSRN